MNNGKISLVSGSDFPVKTNPIKYVWLVWFKYVQICSNIDWLTVIDIIDHES